VNRTERGPIVFVEFSPSGGLFQFAVQMGDALAAAGHRVVLLTGPKPEIDSAQPGFDIRPVLPTWHPADSAVRPSTFRLLRRAVRAGQLVLAWLVLTWHLMRIHPRAVLWSNWRFTFEPMFVVLIARILRGSILGIIAHEPLPRSDAKDTSTPRSGRLLTAAFGAAWRQMDVVFVLGPRTRDVVLQHWEPAGEVVVIPHGDERGLMRDGHPGTAVADTEPIALFFGTWSKYKGIGVLLDAFALVRARFPEARLILAGGVGADVDLPGLLARAQEIGNVDARPGYVAVEDVPAILGSARVVVTPYIRASQSGVVHLAYTFGRPVVSTDVGDLPEVVLDGKTGLLVAAGDPKPLAAAICALLADPQLAEQLGAAGCRMMTDSWSVAAARVLDALDEADHAKDRAAMNGR
jgi:glycosyltransferase involved in cell wall biosynthesis